MNKAFLISLLVLFAAASLCAQQPSSAIQERINKIKEQLGDTLLKTAGEVIAKYVKAVGGRDAVQSVRTLMFRGRILFGGGNPYLARYYKHPNYLRISRSPKNDNYFISNGNELWFVTPEGRKQQKAWWAKSLNHQRIDGNFIDYETRGIKYEYKGLAGFESESYVYYHLRRKFPDGFIEDLYFSVETGLLHCLWKTSSPRKNDPEFYYDYKKVGRILLPHVWVTVFNNVGSPHVLVIEEVKINKDFDEKFFKEYKKKPIQK
jgi:hypothetical protein